MNYVKQEMASENASLYAKTYGKRPAGLIGEV